MKISKYIHSCILIERSRERLLIDPGPFTFIEGKVKAGDFKGARTYFETYLNKATAERYRESAAQIRKELAQLPKASS